MAFAQTQTVSIIMSKFIYIIVIVIVIEYIYYVSNFFREAQRYSTRESILLLMISSIFLFTYFLQLVIDYLSILHTTHIVPLLSSYCINTNTIMKQNIILRS